MSALHTTAPSPSAPSPPRNLPLLAGLLVVCLGIGALGGLVNASAMPTWYDSLTRPSWTPPGWLFGPVWTTLYVMIAVAAWRVLRGGDRVARRVFLVQLALNAVWTPVFFGLRSPALGLLVIVAMWAAIVATIAVFARRDRLAAALLVPYLLWVTFATALNAAIVSLN